MMAEAILKVKTKHAMSRQSMARAGSEEGIIRRRISAMSPMDQRKPRAAKAESPVIRSAKQAPWARMANLLRALNVGAFAI